MAPRPGLCPTDLSRPSDHVKTSTHDGLLASRHGCRQIIEIVARLLCAAAHTGIPGRGRDAALPPPRQGRVGQAVGRVPLARAASSARRISPSAFSSSLVALARCACASWAIRRLSSMVATSEALARFTASMSKTPRSSWVRASRFPWRRRSALPTSRSLVRSVASFSVRPASRMVWIASAWAELLPPERDGVGDDALDLGR